MHACPRPFPIGPQNRKSKVLYVFGGEVLEKTLRCMRTDSREISLEVVPEETPFSSIYKGRHYQRMMQALKALVYFGKHTYKEM
jgi:hypothetical protein